MKRCELLSPAGSFESAIAAFSGGADAVYLGLSDFSARKSARNFSKDELRRLKTAAFENGKKIYVTLNTVIQESEFSEVIETVSFLNEIEIDAVILQDIGLAYILKKLFPTLTLHASTQMAVHTVEGARNVRDLGFSRVVLSRELPLEKIIEIRKSVLDIELEVFIHGALCYSFSGLCLASGIILGRSGNRGECAQICRSFYEMDGTDGYYFSCNDLALKDKIELLADVGIDSLKIEGRMKSPQYVFNTTGFYKALLNKEDFTEKYKNSRICFARKETSGYFNCFSGKDLTGSGYPGHRGVKTGVCEKVENGRFLIKTKYRTGIRDGILFFKSGDEKNPFNCSIEEILSVSGKKLNVVPAGERIFIKTEYLPDPGDEIYLTSSRDLDLKKVNPGSFQPWKKKIGIEISVEEEKLKITHKGFEFSENIIFERSDNQYNFIDKFKDILASSGDFLYSSGNTEFHKNCENIFVVPALLKKIRNRFYEEYSNFCAKEMTKKIEAVLQFKISVQNENLEIFKKRESFVPKGNVPFHLENDVLKNLSEVNGYSVIPLIPVMRNSTAYLSKIVKYIVNNPERKFLLGISNIGHFHLAEVLKENDNVRFFIDFNVYISNRYSYFCLKDIFREKLFFGYFWIENKMNGELSELKEVFECSKNFNPPLFISFGCFEKAGNFKNCNKCNKSVVIRKLINMERTFKIITVDCITFLFLEK